MNIIRKALILLLLALPLTVSAASFVLTHCDGQPDPNQRGYSGRSASISAATAFSADYMRKLEGSKLTQIRFYLDTLKNLNSVSVWIKTDSVMNKSILTSVEVENPQQGWNTVTLAEPIRVNNMGKMFVGYTFQQTGRCFAAKQCQSHRYEDGFWLADGQLWNDYSDQYNALCIEVVAEEYTAYEPDLMLSDLSLDKPYYTVGDTVRASFEVINFGQKAVSDIALSIDVDGSELKSLNKAVALNSGMSTMIDVYFLAPTDVTANGQLHITATHVNGASDGFPADNIAASWLNAFSTFYPRCVVAEEGTGTWCAFCPRGIVGMEAMKEAYPDSFVGISVHTKDEMTIDGYAAFCQFTSYPMVVMDRMLYGFDPNQDDLQALYDYQRAREAFADFSFDATVNSYSSVVKGSATVQFDFDSHNTDYRWVCILTEDSVTGYTQLNAYAGGGYGEMGGFEDRDRYIDDMIFSDVARAVYPSLSGEAGDLPSSITKGTIYSYDFCFDVPDSVQNMAKLSLAVLLVDAHSGMVINAHKRPLQVISSINGITTESTPRYYSLSGMPLSKPTRGIVIEQRGEKTIKRVVKYSGFGF